MTQFFIAFGVGGRRQVTWWGYLEFWQHFLCDSLTSRCVCVNLTPATTIPSETLLPFEYKRTTTSKFSSISNLDGEISSRRRLQAPRGRTLGNIYQRSEGNNTALGNLCHIVFVKLILALYLINFLSYCRIDNHSSVFLAFRCRKVMLRSPERVCQLSMRTLPKKILAIRSETFFAIQTEIQRSWRRWRLFMEFRGNFKSCFYLNSCEKKYLYNIWRLLLFCNLWAYTRLSLYRSNWEMFSHRVYLENSFE